MQTDDRTWLKLIFNIRGSVIPGIAKEVLVVIIFATLVAFADAQGLPVAQENLSGIIPELVLGLLLVFRTDEAYGRFWDGSGIISDIVDLSRSLARSIWVYVDTEDEAAHQEKLNHTLMVGMFLPAVKQHLRGERLDDSMKETLLPEQAEALAKAPNMPMCITQWLSAYLNKMHGQNKIPAPMFTQLSDILDRLTLSMGSGQYHTLCHCLINSAVGCSAVWQARQVALKARREGRPGRHSAMQHGVRWHADWRTKSKIR